ncbi:hypothetical protein CORC01_03703 [Colletotrichum orchidophilum]|uniref:Uncharacterized protein n=1 Tax=Colletotrichum orchidophilum TaxID=1209926 RepID=A0A1G4BHM5_9PEZI|nr:uncharacterized protein CORC01_03703 [Colletotrichum orchidophilum]OHF00875.1 hypothetical protein CORC01_03703 [Colletotrichum orchidophilum]
MACSKCRKLGNRAWNTRFRDSKNHGLGRKTFATCNHCQWSPNRATLDPAEWVRENAPWIQNDVGAFCPCYWGDEGRHDHAMCIERKRARGGTAAAAQSRNAVASPAATGLAPAAAGFPAAAAPAAGPIGTAGVTTAFSVVADNNDLGLFVPQPQDNGVRGLGMNAESYTNSHLPDNGGGYFDWDVIRQQVPQAPAMPVADMQPENAIEQPAAQEYSFENDMLNWEPTLEDANAEEKDNGGMM